MGISKTIATSMLKIVFKLSFNGVSILTVIRRKLADRKSSVFFVRVMTNFLRIIHIRVKHRKLAHRVVQSTSN